MTHDSVQNDTPATALSTSATGGVDAASAADDAGLGAQVRSSVGRLYRRFRSERPDGTLGDSALEVLSRLQKSGPLTLTQLSEIARVAPASMSQSVNRLTSAGYAARSPDADDRRRVLISATPEGAELALAARAQRNAWLDSRLEALSPADQDVLARACALLDVIARSEASPAAVPTERDRTAQHRIAPLPTPRDSAD
ncbi:MarR family winged helix-turn-helix transcriptional regulator [Subtercola endophyticus]|uniref:MarR family winged helix-turn-helix transcriptional regulator n=1 Tax=Subtercola endophyticus TaxID=2895559 RepID=UPI001E4B1E3F|nr:MarR family transcriptional regulator [Subtercola endophyticus]UFS60546.1 MarR family transcriptional regulator [Subtercola endophyticus]